MNGQDTAPVYKYLKSQKCGSLGSRRIKWNFTKFLVDEEGRVIQRYSPTTQPLAIEVLFLSLSEIALYTYFIIYAYLYIFERLNYFAFSHIFDRMISRKH